ncbi:hypothetical protein ACVNS2_16980 [Paenibacillus caseinilyticus]|uniref:Uncharacterized protein n=1 Tax=Paenibacillus mucilaginosus K02 TaxID=997761 RepID=I0BIZ5_9BACL|nr:hypothetical protein [Paenibacillus mucilaginosus]AFH62342.1 hypothetical protein B2K_16710 [Paenibacillus mucilaginosus K02]WFA18732.1 hypothetical protein ERY13_16325 [Paenibacillus mucilaginosus]
MRQRDGTITAAGAESVRAEERLQEVAAEQALAGTYERRPVSFGGKPAFFLVIGLFGWGAEEQESE